MVLLFGEEDVEERAVENGEDCAKVANIGATEKEDVSVAFSRGLGMYLSSLAARIVAWILGGFNLRSPSSC